MVESWTQDLRVVGPDRCYSGVLGWTLHPLKSKFIPTCYDPSPTT